MFLLERQPVIVIVLQILEILFGYLGSYSIKKRNIFIFYAISVIFTILMFWSVGKTAAILPVATTGIRYFIFIFRKKYKTNLPLYFCLLLHVISLVLSIGSSFEDLIPSVLVLAGCLIYWFLDGSKLKGSIFALNIPWIIYYLICGLYVVAINTVIQNALVGIAYFRLKRKENAKHKNIKEKRR
ncbi:YgjV family protein [Candidatus Saccharibacteria bacterium]|nr:YgjV family protein [Candidatus Saccharibacteria bacterium]